MHAFMSAVSMRVRWSAKLKDVKALGPRLVGTWRDPDEWLSQATSDAATAAEQEQR